MGSLSRFDGNRVDFSKFNGAKSSKVIDECRSVLRDQDVIRPFTREEMKLRESSRLRILDSMLAKKEEEQSK
jgi:hypothetical protein